jgi:hypothetical protein
MMNVCIDTALLAIPNFAESATSAEELIDRAFSISRSITEKNSIRMLISSIAEQILWENNCAPEISVITDFLDIMELREFYSPKDVQQAYQTILDRATRFENLDVCEVDKFADPCFDPDLPAGVTPKALIRETARTLLNVCYCSQQGHYCAAVVGLAAGQIKGDVNATALVESSFPSRVGLRAPLPINGVVHILSSLKDFTQDGWPERLWAKARDEIDYHFAIAMRAISILKKSGKECNIGSLLDFTIGPDFVSSVRANQCSGEERFANLTLDVCAQIVANCCARFRRHMHSKDSRKIHRAYDNASAMRVHLTDAHEALRLMYWDADGCVEFANVGPKAELKINHGAKGLEKFGRFSVVL